MPAYSQLHSPNYSPNFIGSTDYNSYGVNATSIDFEHGVMNGITHNYTIALEYWNGSSWNAVELKNGTIRTTGTLKFYLSGKKAGSYRIRGYYWQSGGTTWINGTPAFIVNR